jgi:hypothetical protein
VGWGGCVSLFLSIERYLTVRPLPSAYMRICDSIKELIEELNPDVVVVDNLLNAGIDACLSLNQKFVINSPNALLDVVKLHQPRWKSFFYYPLFVPSTRPPQKLQCD